MFFTYLRRELRRRMRQAVFIALGLALGIGLVITVTAAASGVKNAQGTVLHALYGVGTDVTVTKTPTAGSNTPGSFGFGFRTGTTKRPAAGTKIDTSTLAAGGTLGSISSSSVTTVADLHDVSAAAGGLTLNDRTFSGTIPAINTSGGSGTGGFGGGGGGSGGGGSFRANFTTNSFGVDGVDIGTGELGPLSSGTISSGRTFTTADASSDVALVDSSYATQNKLSVGSTIAIGNSKGTTTNFKVIGIVSEPAGDNPSEHGLRRRQQRLRHQHRLVRDQDGPALGYRDHLERPGQRGHRFAVQRLEPGQQPRQVARHRGADRGGRPGHPADDVGRLAPGP
jgi:putative ABC transport system permease protein